MKQKLYAALLCGVLVLGLAAPASAYYMTAQGKPISNVKHQEFFLENKSAFDALGVRPVLQYYADYVSSEFHDGLLLVQTLKGLDNDTFKYDYVNTDMQLMNLNRDRYYYMSDFSEGLAAAIHRVWDPNGMTSNSSYLTYIDVYGNEVIQLKGIKGLDTRCGLFTGKFIDGRAVVITGTPSNYSSNIDVNFAYIDVEGNFLTDWMHTKLMSDICALPLFNEMGVWIGNYSFGEYSPNKDHWGIVEEGKLDGGQTPVAPTPPPVEQPPLATTYGQSTYKSLGYTIVGNIGYLNIEVTNSGIAPDTGDLFYVLYNKYNAPYRDNTTDFLPADYIRQIHYDLAPGETKILRAGVGQTGALGRELTEAEKDYGWFDSDHIADSRYVLAQAETMSERDELIAFFKTFHYWEGFMELDFQPDANGVTILAAPGGNIQERDGLDKKLAAFTAQF